MERRSFLKALGLSVASISVPPILSGKDIFSPIMDGDLIDPNDPNSRDLIRFSDTDVDAQLLKPVTAIVIGAGSRGHRYSTYAGLYPNSLKIVGVSDLLKYRQDRIIDKFGLPEENRFGDWSEVFKRPKFADAVIIATPDNLHYEPCMKALEMGYDVLLEKPIAQSEKECLDILKQAKKYDRIVAVCHVLRYAPYFGALKQVISSGEIGDVVSVQHFEAIEATHMAHSYVRGNWHNSKETTPILLAKSCHDIDILRWLVDKPFKEVSAFGQLSYFKKENAPAGSAARCLDCKVEKECAFSAKRHYYDERRRLGVFDLVGQGKEAQGKEILDKLRTTNYGRCVFHMDNDQCDHYVTNMKFEDGTTAAFSMEGLTSYGGRYTRVMGTKGDIVGDMRSFEVTDFLTRKKRRWATEIKDGHGGGDMRIVRDFVKAVSAHDPDLISSSLDASVESHVLGYRAERSRLKGRIERL